jgi:hypothetical protein
MGSDLPDNPNLEAIRDGYSLTIGPNGPSYRQYRYRVGDEGAPEEPWWQGVTLFLNPRAEIPLPSDFLKATSIVSVESDDTVVRMIEGFHTLTSFMWVHPRRDPVPKSKVQTWLDLPELEIGEYLVTNMGFLIAPLDECLRLRVPGIPPGIDTPEDKAATLPTITIAADGGERQFRLPTDFGPIARAVFENARQAFEERGRRLLPWIYRLGSDERGAFMVPHGPSRESIDLSKTPLPPPDPDQYDRPWKRRAAR